MHDDNRIPVHATRRDFLTTTAGAAILLPCAISVSAVSVGAELDSGIGPHQATGVRVGEVTENSAIVWTRLTKYSQRNNDGLVFTKKSEQQDSAQPAVSVEKIEGACPGTAGRIRFRYGLSEDLSDATETAWTDVSEGTDYIHQFKLVGLVPDGLDKTIWGAEQKAWFKRTIEESDATWKLLISPTPLVGPDRKNKNDNHSNDGFAHEGNEIREWLKTHAPDNFFVVCGDRHWQYHSVHPSSGTQEFSVGAASDSHAGGTPGENKSYHRFHRVNGGFLSVELSAEKNQSRIAFQLCDVNGEVVYKAAFDRAIV